jgi:ATP-dependent Zn protease
MEISGIIDAGLQQAKQILVEYRSALDAIVEELIKVETLEREDFEKVLITNGITPKKEEKTEAVNNE